VGLTTNTVGLTTGPNRPTTTRSTARSITPTTTRTPTRTRIPRHRPVRVKTAKHPCLTCADSKKNVSIVPNVKKPAATFTFSMDDVEVTRHGKRLTRMLEAKVAAGFPLTFQLITDLTIEWNSHRFITQQKHLLIDTIKVGFRATIHYFRLKGKTHVELGTTIQQDYFLNKLKAWLLTQELISTKDPKLFPIHPPAFLNTAWEIINRVKVNYSDKFNIPILNRNPSPLEESAALILLQFLTFLRPSALYATSRKQALRCAHRKTITIKLHQKRYFVPAIVLYSNVRKHKTLNRGKTKFSALVIGWIPTIPLPTNQVANMQVTVVGKILAIFHSLTKETLQNEELDNWDSLLHPKRVNGVLEPISTKVVTIAHQQLYNFIDIKPIGLSAATRRGSFSTLVYYQVASDLINRCAAWSSARILSFYTNENPMSSSNNIKNLLPDLIKLLVTQAHAHDLFTADDDMSESPLLSIFESSEIEEPEEDDEDNFSETFIF